MRRPRFYSPFWLAGGVLTSPAWGWRDSLETAPDSADLLDMAEWLALSDATRASVVERYATRRPPVRSVAR